MNQTYTSRNTIAQQVAEDLEIGLELVHQTDHTATLWSRDPGNGDVCVSHWQTGSRGIFCQSAQYSEEAWAALVEATTTGLK